MENTPEKYVESLIKAIKSIKIADHILYITYPIIKEKRILLKSLDETYQAMIHIINAVLQYENNWKRIILSPNSKENFQMFLQKCAQRYNITENETREIKELILTMESHKKSAVEFTRRDKVIILEDILKTKILDAEKIKSYLKLSKVIFQKVKNVISP